MNHSIHPLKTSEISKLLKSMRIGLRPILKKPFLPETTVMMRSGGARRDRTDDLLLAKQALSQLSYGPVRIATGVPGDLAQQPDNGGPG